MTHDIHVNDPVYREEVLVTRGNHCLYLTKYEDDTRYVVLDEHGNGTTFTWRGDIEGASDFIALNDMFDAVYDEQWDDDTTTYHADDPRSHG